MSELSGMLIKDTTWSKIRHNFSEEEKQLLRKSVTGETICPKGFCIDKTQVPKELMVKLEWAMSHA